MGLSASAFVFYRQPAKVIKAAFGLINCKYRSALDAVDFSLIVDGGIYG